MPTSSSNSNSQRKGDSSLRSSLSSGTSTSFVPSSDDEDEEGPLTTTSDDEEEDLFDDFDYDYRDPFHRGPSLVQDYRRVAMKKDVAIVEQPVDYFSYKAQTYWPPVVNKKKDPPSSSLGEDHDDPTPTNTLRLRRRGNGNQQRRGPPSPTVPFPLRSYWSPAITPAAIDEEDEPPAPTTVPSPASPAFPHPPIRRTTKLRLAATSHTTITPEGDPFPYIAYESSYAKEMVSNQLSSFNMTVTCTPTPPLLPPPPCIIKVHFTRSNETIKFRCDDLSQTSLKEFVRKCVGRVDTGWEALWWEGEGEGEGRKLKRLDGEKEWEEWKTGGKRKWVLWAM